MPKRAAIVGLLLAACSVTTDPTLPALADLESARAVWRAQAPDDYAYTLALQCFCVMGGQEVRIVVEDGRVVSRTVIETGEAVDENMAQFYGTIPDLLTRIEDAIDRDAHRIDATYDSATGLPTRVYIDYAENVADEELGWEAGGLEVGTPR